MNATKKKVKEPVKRGVAKVPVIMQMEALECGAACLTMVLAYYEKWVPLEKVRVDCGVSRDGSNAGNVLKAARYYGLVADGYKLEPQMLIDNAVFPCIIHWNFNHFVVLDGFARNKAILNDPARGRVEVSMKEFDESFTGICLMFAPGEDFVPSGKPKSVLSFAAKRLKGAGPAIAFVVLTTIISSLCGVISPGFTQVFMDRLLTGKNPDWAFPFLVLLSAFTALQIAVSWINIVYSLRINGKLAIVSNSSFMWKILRLPMEFFSQRMAGDIQSRQNSNTEVASNLVNTFAPLSSDDDPRRILCSAQRPVLKIHFGEEDQYRESTGQRQRKAGGHHDRRDRDDRIHQSERLRDRILREMGGLPGQRQSPGRKVLKDR